MRDTRAGKIIFLDDELGAVQPYITQLRDEGFTNIVPLQKVATLNELVVQQADLVFLDITGVATTLDQRLEGLAVLQHLRRHSPWTRIVVLSGSTFPADKAPQLAEADACISKASLSLAELVALTREQLDEALQPEARNAQVLEQLQALLTSLPLNWWQRLRVQRVVAAALRSSRPGPFDWRPTITTLRKLLANVLEAKALLDALLT